MRLAILILGTALCVQCSTSTAITPATDGGEQVYHSTGGLPEFPGGITALTHFLADSIQYPREAAARGIEGKVTIRVLVDKDGSVTQVEVDESVDPALDAEAVRVCRLLPRFKPGMDNGHPISVWLTIPIHFIMPPAPQHKHN